MGHPQNPEIPYFGTNELVESFLQLSDEAAEVPEVTLAPVHAYLREEVAALAFEEPKAYYHRTFETRGFTLGTNSMPYSASDQTSYRLRFSLFQWGEYSQGMSIPGESWRTVSLEIEPEAENIDFISIAQLEANRFITHIPSRPANRVRDFNNFLNSFHLLKGYLLEQ